MLIVSNNLSGVLICVQLLDWINKTLPWLNNRESDGTLDDMQVQNSNKG